MNIDMMHPADRIVLLMNRIYSGGLTTMSGGNLSIRESNGDLWVTPGGVDKGILHRSDIVCLHPDGSQHGHQKPSSELKMHQAIYNSCPDIQAVLHAHSPSLVAFGIMHEIPTINLIPNTRLVCGSIDLVPYARPGSDELVEMLETAFAKGHSAVLLSNHGICVAADSISKAYMIFETLEYAARSELLARRLGPLRVLTIDQIDIARTEAHIRLSEFRPRSHSSEELALRRDMARMIRRALEQHLFSSTQGTLSTRLSDGSFLITPYGADRWQIHEEDLVLVRRSMKEAGKTPSRAVFLHELIYHHQPDIQAIINAQPMNLTAFTLTDVVLDTHLVPDSYIHLKQLPTVPYGMNYLEAKKVIKLFTPDTPAVLLQNDGVIVTGKDLMQAFDRFETAEFAARIQLSAPRQSELHGLDSEKISELDQYFH